MSKIKKIYKYIIALILGHLTVLKHVFKPPVTLEYPEKKKALASNFRGEHALVCNEDGGLKCTACGTCQRVCPAVGTIKIKKGKDENGKSYPQEYSINLNTCIFCGNCVQSCPFGAIIMTKNYELACEEKSSLKLDIKTLKKNYLENIIVKNSEAEKSKEK